jgi:ribonuclease BN (tRNA processing enzyme)
MQKSKIKFLGTGGAFDYKYGSSAAVVWHNERTFLIDCGPSVYTSLCENKLIDSIDYILLTHLHGDHVGSLFSLIAHLKVHCSPPREAVILYPTESFRTLLATFLKYWFPEPDAYISFVPLANVIGVGFLDTSNLHVRGIDSYAYFFVSTEQLLFYSGDIGDIETSAAFLRTRDEDDIVVFHEMHYRKTKSHIYYRDLMERLAGYRVYGYHVDPTKLPLDNTIPLVANTPELLLRYGENG